MKVRVLKTGVSSSLQDLGRHAGLANGIPIGGAMDKNSVVFLNKLLGNPITNPCIECVLNGGVFEFVETLKFAVVGTGNKILLNNKKVNMNTVLVANRGDQLKISMSSINRYCYLGFKGLIKAEEYWGSYGTYEPIGKGGYNGRALIKGDVLEVKSSPEVPYADINIRELLQIKEARVFPGPEINLFPNGAFKEFLNAQYKVTAESNRMGYRLVGTNVKFTHDFSILSTGVIPGTIQMPPSGDPIVLMADSPSTGGYPRFAVVHSEDLRIVANALPGEKIKFIDAS